MGVNGIGYANQVGTAAADTTFKARRYEEPPKEGTANFEGRKDYDTFEKKEKHTGRNIAIGTTVATLALYAAAAFVGRGRANGKLQWLTKNADKWYGKAINNTTDLAYQSAKWLKANTWTAIMNKFNKGGTGGAAPTP